MEIDEDTSEMDELSQAVWREYETIRGEFSTRILHDIVDNLKFKIAEEGVSKYIDDYLGRHLSSEELRQSACRFGERQEPPCYAAFVLEILRDELTEDLEKPDPRTLGENVLYCFDRDATVETGIPRGPVSLQTVRRLAEENTVYATGNQRLREEADIPGVRDIQDSYVSRRDGISIVWQNESENVDTAVAIDDVDVSDVSDIDVYYEPWEFYLTSSG